MRRLILILLLAGLLLPSAGYAGDGFKEAKKKFETAIKIDPKDERAKQALETGE